MKINFVSQESNKMVKKNLILLKCDQVVLPGELVDIQSESHLL